MADGNMTIVPAAIQGLAGMSHGVGTEIVRAGQALADGWSPNTNLDCRSTLTTCQGAWNGAFLEMSSTFTSIGDKLQVPVMGMTKSTLLGRRPVEGKDPAGFQKASTVAGEEFNAFLPVVTQLTGGVIWTGASQPEAANVATSNSQALEVARIRMDAGAIATTSLVTGMNALHANSTATPTRTASTRPWRTGTPSSRPRHRGSSSATTS